MYYNKTKVKEYLYPSIETEKILKQINEDIYKLIDTKILISENNKNQEYRKKNYRKLYNLLEKYFNQNYNLYDKLLTIYNANDFFTEEVIKEVIYNLVFVYSQTQEQFKNINIFKNRKSICYEKVSYIYDTIFTLNIF